MRKAGLLCVLLLGANAALAQSQDVVTKGTLAQPVFHAPTFTDEDGVAQAYPLGGQRGGERSGELCPTGYLWGQVIGQDTDPACNNWYYSDLNFCSSGLCQRVRYENFPPPGVTVTAPIGVVTWRGGFLDANANGCDKPGAEFRIRFYPVAPGGGPDPNTPYPYEYHVPMLAVNTGETATFQGGVVPTTIWRFTVVLDTPVNLTQGWFGLTCSSGPADCVFLWEGCGEGDSINYEDWESDGWNPTQRAGMECAGLNYCFAEKKVGACVDDCTGTCENDKTVFYCEGIGGRFVQDTNCASVNPPPGEELGACCHDDGSCTPQVRCGDCEAITPPGCVGDLNCDGTVSFGDINPFVQYISNYAGWVTSHPDCNPLNGDINCDGTFGQSAFGDINPFVSVMVQCGQGCPCPGPVSCAGPRTQGDVWAGWNSVCDPNNPNDPYDAAAPLTQCCTIVPGALKENEPDDCATPDTFNGGCDSPAPSFTTLNCGQTMYGESGTSGGHRDTDWYQVTIGSAKSFTVTVEAEFDVAVYGYRAGPNAGSPCDGYRDIGAPVLPPPPSGVPSHNACTPVVFATRCLPAGTYWFVVAPADFDGVLCGSDYQITVTCTDCTPCPPPACPPEGDHSHLETDPNDPNNPLPCNDDPLAYDPNAGCGNGPDLSNFEALPQTPTDPNDSFTFCGKLWANGGYRDSDWYKLEIPLRAQVHWTVDTQIPVRATILFWDTGTGTYDPPPADCASGYYYWVGTVYNPCVQGTWQDASYYEAGTYWFLVQPEETDGTVETPLLYGYPCPMGGADLGNEYMITMSVTSIWCDAEIDAKPHGNVEAEPLNCADPVGYVDTYNNGCDPGDPNHPMLPITFDSANAWVAQTGAWFNDPNDPNSLQKDYDWYKLTLTGNRRFKVYLYANLPASWEIVDPLDANAPGTGCDKGPAEGLEVPACYDQGVLTRRCYTGSTSTPRDYWIRIFPTGRANCGLRYWLALTEPASCNVCSWTACTNNPDDPCDDVNDYDTNAGCDDPNAPPPHYMTFTAGQTYCGRCYAGLVTGAAYYDPDWFQITQTNTANRRLRLSVTAEFIAHVEVYASCGDYDAGSPLAGLDFTLPLTGGTACLNTIQTGTAYVAPNATVYGRITMVDQFGELLTKYYPCVKGYNRWKVLPSWLQ